MRVCTRADGITNLLKFQECNGTLLNCQDNSRFSFGTLIIMPNDFLLWRLRKKLMLEKAKVMFDGSMRNADAIL